MAERAGTARFPGVPAADHLGEVLCAQVSRGEDGTRRAEREDRGGEDVVATQHRESVRQIGHQLDSVLVDAAHRVLDSDDPGQVGQLPQRPPPHHLAGPAGNVIDDQRHGALGGEPGEMSDHPLLRGPGEIRNDGKRGRHLGPRGQVPQGLGRGVGVVRASPGDQRRGAFPAHSRAGVQDGASLPGAERGHLGGRAQSHQPGRAGVDHAVRKNFQCVNRQLAAGAQRRRSADQRRRT
jgi:hypothetical protein